MKIILLFGIIVNAHACTLTVSVENVAVRRHSDLIVECVAPSLQDKIVRRVVQSNLICISNEICVRGGGVLVLVSDQDSTEGGG